MVAYLGGSAFQTIADNPITAYRQLVQQFAKDLNGNVVDPCRHVCPEHTLTSRVEGSQEFCDAGVVPSEEAPCHKFDLKFCGFDFTQNKEFPEILWVPEQTDFYPWAQFSPPPVR